MASETKYPSEIRGMAADSGREILLAPGFKHPYVGDVVALNAVDWGYEDDQLPASSAFSIVRGRIYGEVIVCNDEWITVAMQVFYGGDVRCTLSIPWATVTKLIVLERLDAQGKEGDDGE